MIHRVVKFGVQTVNRQHCKNNAWKSFPTTFLTGSSYKISRTFSDNASTASTNDASATGETKPAESTEAKPAAEVDEVTKLQNEVKSLKDQLLRQYAEGENIRRIAARDVDNARTYANTSFAKALLEIADDLERALLTVPEEKKKNSGEPILDNLVAGIEMTDKNLQKVFKKFGVVKYGAVDEKFDPNIHEALFQVPDATKEAGTIAQIVKIGYKINDRVLRPAQVGARVKP